jgi:hypothetical protein
MMPPPPPRLPLQPPPERTFQHPVLVGLRGDVWSDMSILGYRGNPGAAACYPWDPALSPCVPSDERPKFLISSREAAEAVGAASRVEQFSPGPDGHEFDDDEEQYELARVKCRFALRRFQESFPELDPRPSDVFCTHASQQLTRPCPCGSGVLARWPWVVQTMGLGFCDCGMASWELTCWRSEWIKAGAPNLAW